MYTVVSNHVAWLIIVCAYIYYVNGFSVKLCDNIGSFKQMFGISLTTCAEECFRRQRCTVFMFHFGMRHCALKDDIDVQSLGEEGPVCRYYTRDDWSQVDLGPCNGHTCSETERCTSKTVDEFQCVKSECRTPVEMANARLLSNTKNIGATNRYKCNDRMPGQGTPTITCGDDAEWSVTDFVCLSKIACPVPEQHYINADLTHVEGSQYAPGTVLTFTCREGYRKLGDEWKSTCQTSLLWEPDGIRCCPVNTKRGMNKCYAIIEGGIATSFAGAEDYCESMGWTFVMTLGDLRYKYNTTTTDYALQSTKISIISTDWNYVECAAENGVHGNESKTFQEKVAEAVENDWGKSSACRYGTMWSHGQPNSTSDDCVIRDTHVPYKHYSYPCNFTGSTNIGFACEFDTPMI